MHLQAIAKLHLLPLVTPLVPLDKFVELTAKLIISVWTALLSVPTTVSNTLIDEETSAPPATVLPEALGTSPLKPALILMFAKLLVTPLPKFASIDVANVSPDFHGISELVSALKTLFSSLVKELAQEMVKFAEIISANAEKDSSGTLLKTFALSDPEILPSKLFQEYVRSSETLILWSSLELLTITKIDVITSILTSPVSSKSMFDKANVIPPGQIPLLLVSRPLPSPSPMLPMFFNLARILLPGLLLLTTTDNHFRFLRVNLPPLLE